MSRITDQARAAVDLRSGGRTWQEVAWGEGIPCCPPMQGNHETETPRKPEDVLKAPVN